MRCIEDVCVFYKKLPAYNPQGLEKLEKPIKHDVAKSNILNKKKNPSLQTHKGYPKHLLEFSGINVSSKESVHPTQKPVALLEYFINTYTNAGGVVLDNCMGSGSTGVAAVHTGRRFIGIEKEKKYFDIARERIGKAVIQNADQCQDESRLHGS